MVVVKRDHKETDVNIQEIREAAKWACKNLPLSYLELESHIDSIYRERISTVDIQKSLIDIAIRLTTVEQPEWRVVAARLLIMELYKEVAHHRNYESFGYGDYSEFLKEAVKKGLYDGKIFEFYTEHEIVEAGKNINPEFDLDFDFAGANIMINRYLIKDGHNAFELPQQLFMTIALWLASKEEREKRMEFVISTYELIAGKAISLATPILLNLRRNEGNLSSCFISAIDDSLDSIFYNIDTVAQISKNGGGVGVNLSRIRAKGSEIKGVPGASGGIIPWIKILNDTAVAVNQLGKRAGAVTTALDIWHLDLEDFLELRTETGDQRKKAYDIFPQLVIPDIFMKRVKSNEFWTLFDPREVLLKYQINLAELWGEKFEKHYKALENDDNLKLKKSISAKNLFKQIMKMTIETGMPYLFFKDTVNSKNPNKHSGMIGNGNLCQESFSNFHPTQKEKTTVTNGKIISESKSGLVHSCNLVSINLATTLDEVALEKACFYAVRILDNTIDLTMSPVPESNLHNKMYRAIGVGTMGLADYLAKNGYVYDGSAEIVDKLFEKIAFHTISASVELAKERGAYEMFKGSEWEQGVVFGRSELWYKNHSAFPEKWEKLIGSLKTNGIRNGQLLAIAPNTSSALLQGCSPSVLPIYSKFHVDKNANGTVPICPPFIKENFWHYKENKNISQIKVVKVIAAIQKWVDQGISFELLYNLNNNIKAKEIYDTLLSAWESGCKTIYYTRTIQKNSNIMNEKEECVSCAN